MKTLLACCDPPLREALRPVLESQGCHVVVEDQIKSLDPCLDGEDLSLVLLAVDSLGGEGPAWCRRLHEATGTAGCPIWAVTASTDARYHAALLEAGADRCVTEPIDAVLLAARLAAARRAGQIRDELAAVYGGMADGVLVADALTRRFLRTNAAMCRLSGYSDDELVSMGLEELHPPESLPEVLSHFEALVRGHYARAENIPVRRKDGSVVFCDVSCNPLCYRGRRCAVGFFRDVTARRQAERDLARSEARFRAIFEGAVVGGALTDLDSRLVECNAAFARMLGYTAGELRGRLTLDLTHPDDREQEKERFEAFLRGEVQSVQLEKRYRHKDGGTVWARVSAAFLPEPDHPPRLLVATVEDITERRLAEQALQESEATLRTLIENMPDIVVMLDPDWNIHYINQGNGILSPKDVVGTNALSYVSAEHQGGCLRAMRQALDGGEVARFELRDRFGGWWSCRLVPVMEDQAVRSLMMICADVSQRRTAEEKVHQEQELLRRLLDLFERDRELVAFEIHDGFSQQLTGALLNFEAVEPLREESPREAEAVFQSGLALLRESIEEARRLVRGLRPPVLDQFGIVPAIEHLLEDLASGVGPRVEFLSGLKSARLAPPLEAAIFRMVQETLSNVRRHSQSDRARVELLQDGQSVRLVVTDWGIGFDPERVGSDHFGLRGIRERARLLGGRAEIESAPDRGTRIRVVLPLVEAAPPPPPGTSKAM